MPIRKPTKPGLVEFTVPIAEVKFDASGDPDAKGRWTMRGHAAVFNRKSHDLGGFRTVIAPGAFTKILDTNPDVHMVWDHDTRWVLARTRNNSLELREDPYGLHVWARFAKTQTADEVATLMEGGFIDQMSFKCEIGADEWTENDEGITRTIFQIDGLYDVCVCAQGAFPQTDAQLVAHVHDAGALLASVREQGRLIQAVNTEGPDLVAAVRAAVNGSIGAEVGRNASQGEGGDIIAPVEAPEGGADVADERNARLAALRESVEARYAQHTQPK